MAWGMRQRLRHPQFGAGQTDDCVQGGVSRPLQLADPGAGNISVDAGP